MYRYYSTERPVSPGAFPKLADNPVRHIKNFNARAYVGKIGREAWGYLEYEKPLAKEQIVAFELVPASVTEDKGEICSLLCKALQKTRGASDLLSLEFDSESEIVTATFAGGNRKINVACDSGTAMIRDIINHLEC